MYWAKRLPRAKRFTEKERVLALSFTTCAVGEAHDMHPDVVELKDNGYGVVPTDDKLQFLGQQFYYRVAQQDPDGARECYAKIQERVYQLMGS